MAGKVNILVQYLDFLDLFSQKLPAKLFKHSDINEDLIDLESDKEPLYGLIYSLELVKLEVLKTYIKTNLVHGFIQLLKSPVKAFILFVKKPDNIFSFFVNY